MGSALNKRCGWAVGLILLLVAGVAAQPEMTIDLLAVPPEAPDLMRVYGHTLNGGKFGQPVAGGEDCDDDGFNDMLLTSLSASPRDREDAGEVYLIFGDGTIGGEINTNASQERVLVIMGDDISEATGIECWMDDVTGDDIADLLIGRMNHSPDVATGERIGAGALSIIVGGPELQAQANTLEPIDFRSPPPGITITTIIGANFYDRFGIWMRTGDVDGDGIADIAVGADQETITGELNRGALYVILGGAHLDQNQTLDLAEFGSTAIGNRITRISPPAGADEYHFGATNYVADLDGNGREEVIIAAAMSRGGAGIQPHSEDLLPIGKYQSSGGAPQGWTFIAWDDLLATPWPPSNEIVMTAEPASETLIRGSPIHQTLGEEILGGLDYNGNGEADLFLGDLGGSDLPGGTLSEPGTGLIIYEVAQLKGLDVTVSALPPSVETTFIVGPGSNSIGGDTATHGDFDHDGIDDLAFGSPQDHPQGRFIAGSLHVFYGQVGGWPEEVRLEVGSEPPSDEVRMVWIQGARGSASGGDLGDMMFYSGDAGDFDNDGRDDLIINEMTGNGISPEVLDAGNLVILNGRAMLDREFLDSGLMLR